MSDLHSGPDPHFEVAAQIVCDSRVFALIRRVAGWTVRLLEESRAVAVTRSRSHEFSRLAAPTRLRIAGLMLLCAAITNAVLLAFVSRQMAPSPPFLVPVVAGLAAILLMARSSRRSWLLFFCACS